jgi:CheY-like chemotaxis protein
VNLPADFQTHQKSRNTHSVKPPIHRVGKVNSLKFHFGSRQGNSFNKSFGKKSSAKSHENLKKNPCVRTCQNYDSGINLDSNCSRHCLTSPMQPKILLIDNREENHLAMEAMLAPDGYQLIRAYSGLEALRILLNDLDFAMILLDVKMPLLSGFETAELIYKREKLRHIPIIFITAHNYGDDYILKGYSAGGIDYIIKPINPEVLRTKVAVFLEIYKRNALLVEQERKLTLANLDLEKEVYDLKAANHKLRLFATNLQNDIAELTSILLSSKLAVTDSTVNDVI